MMESPHKMRMINCRFSDQSLRKHIWHRGILQGSNKAPQSYIATLFTIVVPVFPLVQSSSQIDFSLRHHREAPVKQKV